VGHNFGLETVDKNNSLSAERQKNPCNHLTYSGRSIGALSRNILEFVWRLRYIT